MVKSIRIASKGERQMKAVVQRITTVYGKAVDVLRLRSWILPAVLSLVLYALAVRGMDSFNQLLLFDDEFGYWTASAYLTGTDWKSVASGIPYYSYGYGFLILTPIRLLFSSTETMYKAAIVANALLLVGSFWIARTVARQIFEDMNQAALDAICFVIMLYPSNIVFSHIAWAECLLVFVFWVFVWVSLRVIRKPSVWNHIGIAVTVMILYVVHQRTIAVAIATVMVMIWCFAIDKGRRKNIIMFVVTMGVLIGIHCFIKEDLMNDYYYNNIKMSINNIEGQTDKLQNIFSVEGFWNLIKSIIGKWFYLFVATFMMAWWSAEFLFRNAGLYLKQSFKNIKNHDMARLPGNIMLWHIWILLAFAGNFMIAAIYMGMGNRNDGLLYGRYTEYMIGIYFLIGIITFIKDEKWIWKFLIYIPITFRCGMFCQRILDRFGRTSYQAYHSIATSLFLEKGSSAEGDVIAYAVGGILFSAVILYLIKIKPWKRWNWLLSGMALAIVIVLFNGIAGRMIYGVMTDKQCLRIANIRNLVGWIEWIDEDGDYPVYYCKDTESRYWSESFQFILNDTPLSVITSDTIIPEEDAFYIVGTDFLWSEGFEQQYYCVRKSNQFAVIVQADKQLAERARELTGEQQ